MFFRKSPDIPSKAEALPGRSERMPVPEAHFVNKHPLQPPFPDGLERAMFGMGCFWGAERKFWQLNGVYSTAVGYAAGHTPNATYREVCTGLTGHTEAVLVVFDPKVIRYEDLLQAFWESHNPTQGMRQGNDVGTQYRSGIYYYDEAQRQAAEASRDAYQPRLTAAGHGEITTEILPAPEFYYAEDYHQQYLAKNPGRLLRAGWHRRELSGGGRRRPVVSLTGSNTWSRRLTMRIRCHRCAAARRPLAVLQGFRAVSPIRESRPRRTRRRPEPARLPQKKRATYQAASTELTLTNIHAPNVRASGIKATEAIGAENSRV